jgi:hypothetical protein
MQMDSLKGQLWAAFRSASTQIRLFNQLQSTIYSQQDPNLGALDHYFTM